METGNINYYQERVKYMSFRMHPFVDELGRISDKPYDQEYGITDNPWLFLGEWALLSSALNESRFDQVMHIHELLKECNQVRGLYSRHPKQFIKKYPFTINKMSHDEQNGLAFIAVAFGAFSIELKNMNDYMKDHNNQYYDLVPYSDFFKALKRNFKGTIKGLKEYLKDLKDNPDNTNAVDLNHDGDIVAISAYRQPRDVAFYRIAAGQKASLLGILWLSVAILLSTRTSVDDGSRGGKMLMAWFRNIALKKCKIEGLRYITLRLAIKFFNWRLIKKYGKDYPVFIMDKYFDRKATNGQRHPMIALLKKYVDKFGT